MPFGVAQMLAHRAPRRDRIAGADRIENPLMFGDVVAPSRSGHEQRLHACCQRLGVLFPKDGHQPGERAVRAGFGDAQMEQAIAGGRASRAAHVGGEPDKRGLDASKLGRRNANGGQRRRLGFDQAARLQHVERRHLARADGRLAAWTPGPGRRTHIDAGADPDGDAMREFERRERFAQRRARHTELGGQHALARQPLPAAEFAGVDQPADLVGNPLIFARDDERLQRHARECVIAACYRLPASQATSAMRCAVRSRRNEK